MTKLKFVCLFCNKIIIRDNHGFNKKRLIKFCSLKCYGYYQRNRPKKLKLTFKGIHSWAYKNFIKPTSCDFCHSTPLQAIDRRSELQWANKTGKYLRDREDWFCLCRSCHYKYDKPWLKRPMERNKLGRFVKIKN
jgi:ribosomal protein L24E